MMRNIFYAVLLFSLLTSCSSYRGMMNADGNIRKVKIGMTQEEVIAHMGSHYEVIEANQEFVIWGYKAADDGIYKLRFVSDTLVGWNKIWLNKYEYDKDNTAAINRLNPDDSAKRIHLKAHRDAMLSSAKSDAERASINAHMDAVEKGTLGD